MGDQFVNAVERLHEKCGLMSFELWKIRKNKDEGKNGSTDDFNTLSTKLRKQFCSFSESFLEFDKLAHDVQQSKFGVTFEQSECLEIANDYAKISNVCRNFEQSVKEFLTKSINQDEIQSDELENDLITLISSDNNEQATEHGAYSVQNDDEISQIDQSQFYDVVEESIKPSIPENKVIQVLSDIDLGWNTSVVHNLAVDAISQMEDTNQSNCMDSQMTDDPIPLFDIQHEVTVETSEAKPIRKRKSTRSEVELLVKRRRSMDVRTLSTIVCDSSDDIKLKHEGSFFDTEPIIKQEPMKKCNLNRRKTICFTKSPFDVDETDNVPKRTIISNNNAKMHATNSFYTSFCVLCDKKKNISVTHYLQSHPDHEVFIARPSPKVATKIRSQKIVFKSQRGMLSGFCAFCEQLSQRPKSGWAKHLLTHTGEKTFNCTTCGKNFKYLNEHDSQCSAKPVNIYLANSKNDLVAFMCNYCNYTQFHRDNMIKHMKNEHNYQNPDENLHYGAYALIPAPVK